MVAETTLRKTFTSWIVHDHHDFQQLRKLCHSIGIRLPDVTITSLDLPRHHIPQQGRIPADVALSLLDVVSCTEPGKDAAVMNNIIDAVKHTSV